MVPLDEVGTVARSEKEARVLYHDPWTGQERQVRCHPLEDGVQVVLALRDAGGKAVRAVLTPELSAAVRTALALVDLAPGAKVIAL